MLLRYDCALICIVKVFTMTNAAREAEHQYDQFADGLAVSEQIATAPGFVAISLVNGETRTGLDFIGLSYILAYLEEHQCLRGTAQLL